MIDLIDNISPAVKIVIEVLLITAMIIVVSAFCAGVIVAVCKRHHITRIKFFGIEVSFVKEKNDV